MLAVLLIMPSSARAAKKSRKYSSFIISALPPAIRPGRSHRSWLSCRRAAGRCRRALVVPGVVAGVHGYAGMVVLRGQNSYGAFVLLLSLSWFWICGHRSGHLPLWWRCRYAIWRSCMALLGRALMIKRAMQEMQLMLYRPVSGVCWACLHDGHSGISKRCQRADNCKTPAALRQIPLRIALRRDCARGLWLPPRQNFRRSCVAFCKTQSSPVPSFLC